MSEKSGKGVEGHLLYNPLDEKYFFRVYAAEKSKDGLRKYTDYTLKAEDIPIVITSDLVSLFHSEEGNSIEFATKYTKYKRD